MARQALCRTESSPGGEVVMAKKSKKDKKSKKKGK
jgi:hypothetical protein